MKDTHEVTIEKENHLLDGLLYFGDCGQRISVFEAEINNINSNLDNIHLDKLNKLITEEQFNRARIKLENELKLKQDR